MLYCGICFFRLLLCFGSDSEEFDNHFGGLITAGWISSFFFSSSLVPGILYNRFHPGVRNPIADKTLHAGKYPRSDNGPRLQSGILIPLPSPPPPPHPPPRLKIFPMLCTPTVPDIRGPLQTLTIRHLMEPQDIETPPPPGHFQERQPDGELFLR